MRHPLPLRSLSPRTVELHRRLGRGLVWSCDSGGVWQRFELSMAMGYQPSGLPMHPSSQPCGVLPVLVCPAGPVVLDNLALVQLASGIAWNDSDPAAQIEALGQLACSLWDPDLRRALGGQLEMATAPLSSLAEPVTTLHLSLVEEDGKPGMAQRLRMTVESALHWLQDPRWHSLATPHPGRPDAVPWANVPCHGHWLLGNTTLTTHAFTALACGDAILIEHDRRRHEAPCDVRFGTVVLRVVRRDTGPWILEHMEEYDMDPFAPTSQLNGSAPNPTSQSALQDMDIRLSFSVGQVQMRLAELMALETGSIVDLKSAVSARVTVAANGQPIGTGELVEIDGQLAVVIQSLAGDSPC